jgi:hypothetical protein
VKPLGELTYLGRVRRMRQVADVALQAYALDNIRFKLITFGGNALFRVYAHCPDNDATAQGLFEAGQYLLRIHQPGHRETGQIRLELEWLSAMRREAGLPVPEPVCTTGGELLVQVEVRDVPGVRACSLLRWVKGRSAGGREKQEHYRKQGHLMAKLHDFAATWPIPPGCTKRHYNWDGLFKNDTGIGMPASKAWQFLTPDYVEPFKVVTQRVRQLMDTWGTGLDVYGLMRIYCSGRASRAPLTSTTAGLVIGCMTWPLRWSTVGTLRSFRRAGRLYLTATRRYVHSHLIRSSN